MPKFHNGLNPKCHKLLKKEAIKLKITSHVKLLYPRRCCSQNIFAISDFDKTGCFRIGPIQLYKFLLSSLKAVRIVGFSYFVFSKYPPLLVQIFVILTISISAPVILSSTWLINKQIYLNRSPKAQLEPMFVLPKHGTSPEFSNFNLKLDPSLQQQMSINDRNRKQGFSAGILTWFHDFRINNINQLTCLQRLAKIQFIFLMRQYRGSFNINTRR